MAVAMEHALRITSDEVNCLIYAYLLDSGFNHAAFAVKMEGHLDRSPHSSKHIQRGELIELLSKALLYIEVESHWKAGALANNCKSGFSLLEPHVCSLETSNPTIQITPLPDILDTSAPKPPPANGASLDAPPKRKESPTSAPTEGPAEKRTKRDPDDMDLDISAECKRVSRLAIHHPLLMRTPYPLATQPKSTLLDPKAMKLLPDPSMKKVVKPKVRPRGPGDDTTDPNAILCLPGHKAEATHRFLLTSKDAIVNLWNLPKPPKGPDKSATAVAPVVVDYFSKSEQGDLTSIDWNADGTLVAIGSYDSILRICTYSGTLSTGVLITLPDCCLDVEWLTDEIFATCGADQNIFIMSVDDLQPIKSLEGHMNEVNQIKSNPSGTRIASCSDDMTARIWNVGHITNSPSIPGLSATIPSIVMQGHRHSVSTIAWCPDPTLGPHPLIATSSFDTTARLWDSVTGKCLKSFLDHKRPTYEKRWSWYAGAEKPGVFELDWQVVESEGINRIALALECRDVVVIDVSKIPSLQDDPKLVDDTIHVS
ncbi:hypothetical protein H0H81_012238 [Sphagnurus paluster]|uniref:WD40 repeat-like protein n=1 Tax=Sphagnurus paluster TaxID=117069 RepID=A0A9P7G2X5_9AGAR|nr:hypothetical protein H0H81_012238 [Sphagnurus paluster]